MTDKPAAAPVVVTDPHNVPVIFCNQVVGSGHLNSVINVTLGVAQFTGRDGKVDPDFVIASRLRMDLFCAQQLRDALTSILEQALKPANGTTH